MKAPQSYMVSSHIGILSFASARIGGIIPMGFSFVPIICDEMFMIWIPTLKNSKRKKVNKF